MLPVRISGKYSVPETRLQAGLPPERSENRAFWQRMARLTGRRA